MTQRPRFWLSETLIILALLLLPLLFWWQLWTPDPADRAVIPEGDFTSQYYPLQLFAARELAAGRLPPWNPYLNAGQPGLADIQTGVFYPPNLLLNLILALLGRPFTVGWLAAQVVLHFSLASLFTYLFVRRLARRAGARTPAARFAGAVAALTFTYAGYLTSFPVQQLTILETTVWLPLILLFITLAVDAQEAGGRGQEARGKGQGARGRGQAAEHSSYFALHPASCILTALALACALLAGHPQTAMYVVYAALAYGLFLAWSSSRSRSPILRSPLPDSPIPQFPGSRRILRVASCLILPLVIGASLAAVQLAPTLQFIARSTRAGLDYEAVAWGFPLAEATHLLYPGYFGGSPQYVGLLPLVLAVAAWVMGRARREVAFWTVLGAAALVLAFGGHTFLYNVTYLLVPGFGAVRNQERIIYLFSLAVSVLAGYGALTLARPLPRPAHPGFCRFVRGLSWTFVAFLALTALWYLGYLQGLQQGVEVNLFEGVLRHHTLLLLMLGGTVALFALRRTGQARRRWLMALALSLIWLNLFTINWRFNLAAPTAEGPFPETGLVTFLKAQPGVFRISSAGLLPGGASAGAVYEIEDITANTPLRLDAFQQFEDQVGSWRRWQLLNVRYVLDQRALDGPGLERVYEEGEVKVYRVGDPLPRAWVVHHATVADDEAALRLLDADEFDPRATALLPAAAEVPPLSDGGGAGDSVQVIEAVPGRLVLDVSAGSEGLLVVSQPFYPGWRAQVDGQTAPLYRVDYVLQGVPLEAGRHRVELRYRLSPWPALVSLAALIGCLVGLFLLWRRA